MRGWGSKRYLVNGNSRPLHAAVLRGSSSGLAKGQTVTVAIQHRPFVEDDLMQSEVNGCSTEKRPTLLFYNRPTVCQQNKHIY